MSLAGTSVKKKNVRTDRNIAIFCLETFCYLDTISKKVCFMAILL